MYGQFATPEQEAKAVGSLAQTGLSVPSQLLCWSLERLTQILSEPHTYLSRHCLWPSPGRGSHVVLTSGLVAAEWPCCGSLLFI